MRRLLTLATLCILMINLPGCSFPGFTISPTNEPDRTQTSTSLPTFTPSITPSPTPTPTPEIRVSNADQALFDGDYGRARQEYQTAYAASTDEMVRAAALWGLGRVEFLTGYYDQSLVYLKDLVSNFSNSPYSHRAYFLLGQSYDALQRHQDAASAYGNYLKANSGLIDSYVQEHLADSLANDGSFSDSLLAYQAALRAPRTGDTTQLELNVAGMFSSLGDYPSSLAIYNDIATRTTNDYVKAQMDFLIGQTYLNMGQAEQGYPYFSDTVAKYPLAYDSYSALVALVEAGIPVDDLDRGLVDYFAGQYGVAQAAFDRYLADHPDHDGTVLHYLALTLRENGEYQQAVDNWTLLINSFPENRYWESAWDERAYTLWAYMEDFQGASQSLLDFVTSFPNHQNAPFYLNSAARIQERGGQHEESSTTWQSIAEKYPGSELVPDALFSAGIELYRIAAYDRAQVVFQKDLILSSLPADQARAYLWIGKTQQELKDNSASQQSFQLAAGLDPTGYYSERARDILLNRAIFESPPSYDFSYDVAIEKAEAESWIRVTFNLPPTTDLGGVGPLATDLRFERGTELWELGLYDEARLEFEDLRLSVAEDPIGCYRLANYMLDLRLYRIAIATSRQLLKLAGLETYTQMLVAPQYFNHINYGTNFQDLVVSYAREYNFDPLFLFSVISQESSFEGFVHSSAGARGLMQIMPDTGQSIADNLGWPPNYTSDDLYRPYINLRLGASYLSSNKVYFNGDFFAALAAYNAGPGNAGIWEELSGGDPDLFLELIRYSETKDYISHIYEIYLVYRSTYGNIP
jgi:soluble lytic murein transglycosylase